MSDTLTSLGHTVDEAEDVIALIYYYDYLANYEPPKEEKPEYKLQLKENLFNNFFASVINRTEFADVRNRSYAA